MWKPSLEPSSRLVEAVLGWHRANDERGLAEEERSTLNKRFLHYILDDLMPWHRSHDFSLLEVNRYIHDYHLHVATALQFFHAFIQDNQQCERLHTGDNHCTPYYNREH